MRSRLIILGILLAVGIAGFIAYLANLSSRFERETQANEALRNELDQQRAALQALETKLAALETGLLQAQGQAASASSEVGQLQRKIGDLERRMARAPADVFPTRRLDQTENQPQDGKRSWGPEQATGPPDTAGAGDIPTAWATRDPDSGPEWLRLDYTNAVYVAEVRIRETYNPGAVSKVTGMANGFETVLWEGTEAPGNAPRDFKVTVAGNVLTQTIVVYLETTRVPGWNEIDAVELIGRDGSHQWAARASASSTYAERNENPAALLNLER